MTACANNNQDEKEILHFQRLGGGELNFCVYGTKSDNTIQIHLKSIDYYENDTIFIIQKSDETNNLFNTLYSLSENQSILQDNKQPKNSMCTGTWVSMYVRTDNGECEIANPDLLRKSEPLESVVRDQIK